MARAKRNYYIMINKVNKLFSFFLLCVSIGLYKYHIVNHVVLFFFFQEHMVENEVSILRRVKHRNIVELIEEYETPKEIFLVMELVKVSPGQKMINTEDIL